MGDNSEAMARYRAAIESVSWRDAAVLDDLAADDFVQEWRQSGERIRKEGEEDQRAVRREDGQQPHDELAGSVRRATWS